MLRILAERNRPHGQMLGEEAQEALQGKRQGSLQVIDTSHAHMIVPSPWLYLCHIPGSPPPTWDDPGFSAVSSNRQLLSLSQRPGEHLPSPCNIFLFLRFPPQLPQHLEKSAYPGLHQVSLGV